MIYLNGDPINVTLFPDGTSQVWKLDEKHLLSERAMIIWDFSCEGELVHLAQLKHLLTSYGVDRILLQMNYLPYGRQDKYVKNDATFALRTFAHIINSMNFTEIFIMDPHSQVALDVIKKSRAVYPHGPLGQVVLASQADLVCYPDNGAVTKYTKIYDLGIPTIYGSKQRDQATGHITSYTVMGDCRGHNVLIVDDICDGGKTFEILAKDLLLRGAYTVSLFVTHGLFTKGLRPLKDAGISRIFTSKGEAFPMSDGGFGLRKIENGK